MSATPGSPPAKHGLNEVQQRAVEYGDGAMLILAGPGSGKTRVITHRIAHLVRDRGVHPWRILAVTFTNKAAREMRERVHQLLGDDARDVHMGTFHAMCARWLRVDGAAIGVQPQFVIYDDADQVALVKQVLESHGIDVRTFAPRSVLGAISNAKNEQLTPSDLRDRSASYADEVVARAYRGYQERLRSVGALDFDDLLSEGLRLFVEDEAARTKYTERYRYVLVDEFQDTNPVQYRLATMLAAGHGNPCVVGDPDQSIYSWRAADSRNVDYFRRDFPGAEIFLLEQNYRSTSPILAAADAVIGRNPGRHPRTLWTDRPGGELITTYEAYSDEEEGEWLAREVARLAATGRKYSDIAVLYRTNALSRPIEEALVRRRIPYRLIGGVRFYQRREVKDLIAYLRLLHNPEDEASFLRVNNVPARGIGSRTIERLQEWATGQGLRLKDACDALAHGTIPGVAARSAAAVRGFLDGMEALRSEPVTSLPDLLDRVIVFSGYERSLLDGDRGDSQERLENLAQLRAVLEQYSEMASAEDGGLGAFLQDVALVADVDELEGSADAVTLLTLHSAKGLEFPIVFMVGLEEGVLPHARAFDELAGIEEERRLAYVGMTRAGDLLYLSRAYKRFSFGAQASNPASRFLADVPPSLTRPWSSTGPRSYIQAVLAPPASEDFRPADATWNAGDRVAHAKFGEGTVVGVQKRGGDVELSVAFDSAGLKRLLQSMAPLRPAARP